VLILDLHGIKHAEVPRQIDTFIWQAMQRDHTHIEIITGHSDEMKLLVSQVVKDYGMDCSVKFLNQGALLVHLK